MTKQTMRRMLDETISTTVPVVMAAARSLPAGGGFVAELEHVRSASLRGYFLPDEDEAVRLRYMQYLALRGSLLDSITSLAVMAEGDEEDVRLAAFATGFAAACLLARASRFVSNLAEGNPVLWKKLDEDDRRLGLPRKTFTRLYRDSVSPATLARFHAAAEYYRERREDILRWRDDATLEPIVELLENEEPWIEKRKRDAVRRHFLYRLFSFRRRQRSAWRQVMLGMFKIGGTAIADLVQPGVKPRGAPKRMTAALREELSIHLRPGDVIVTRHDDALSNLFLPGFWPHAALYLGTAGERSALGLSACPRIGDPIRFLEAKKDGVLFRPPTDTLEVDACVVIRPPLDGELLAAALRRAMEHEGKLFDFLFDFRGSDRLACTAVIYRGFHGVGPVNFRLKEVSGRLCLPAEDLLDQAISCGFQIVATCGIGENPLLLGESAEAAFRATRKPL